MRPVSTTDDRTGERPLPPPRWQTARVLALIGVGTIGAWGVHRRAVAENVAVDKHVMVVTRALSYDNNLVRRAGKALVVAALSRAGVPASESAAEAVARAFRALAGVKVQGLPIQATHVRYTTAAALVAAIDAQGIDILHVGPALEGDLASVLEVSRRKQVVTVGAHEDQVVKGVSLGVVSIGAKMTIVVNLPASKGEGAAFAMDLLRLAKVIR
jgi:hypothetical protein